MMIPAASKKELTAYEAGYTAFDASDSNAKPALTELKQKAVGLGFRDQPYLTLFLNGYWAAASVGKKANE